MTKQWVRCLLVGAMLALSVGSAQALVVFDNLANTHDGASQTADVDGFQRYLAQSFITDSGPLLGVGSITLYMDLNATGGSGTAQVSIWSSDPAYASTVPQPLNLWSTLTSPASIGAMGNYTFTSPDQVALSPNTMYWVVLSSTGTSVFDWYNTDMTPATGYKNQIVKANNAWYPTDPNNPNTYPAAFSETYVSGINWGGDVNAPFQLSIDAVPEPSTYALLVISLGVVGYARKKMNLKA